jgi:hypothetical protein
LPISTVSTSNANEKQVGHLAASWLSKSHTSLPKTTIFMSLALSSSIPPTPKSATRTPLEPTTYLRCLEFDHKCAAEFTPQSDMHERWPCPGNYRNGTLSMMIWTTPPHCHQSPEPSMTLWTTPPHCHQSPEPSMMLWTTPPQCHQSPESSVEATPLLPYFCAPPTL